MEPLLEYVLPKKNDVIVSDLLLIKRKFRGKPCLLGTKVNIYR